MITMDQGVAVWWEKWEDFNICTYVVTPNLDNELWNEWGGWNRDDFQSSD